MSVNRIPVTGEGMSLPDVCGGFVDVIGSSGVAGEMSAMPQVWRRLLAAHVPDRLGRCTSCRHSSGSGEKWPCNLHRVAAEAERLYDLRLGQAVGGE
ncbi:hypothetical protein [Pseudonocardia abyssalis]|nr:hypothetical protein [Pseudonocardia abyssalis]MBW0117498.1 hypothetical protein [Pseudonocardia abyssalis]